jgi:transcriptional regulator with XRE-family HTH domain
MDRTGEEAIKQRFGARMRELRKARGLSQEALAFASGLDRSYLGAIERGEKNVSLVNIHRIAEALGTGPSELFAS